MRLHVLHILIALTSLVSTARYRLARDLLQSFQSDEHGGTKRIPLQQDDKGNTYIDTGVEKLPMERVLELRLRPGVTKVKYRQMYQGLPVWDTNLVLNEIDPNYAQGQDWHMEPVIGQLVENLDWDFHRDAIAKSKLKVDFNCEQALLYAYDVLENSPGPSKRMSRNETEKMVYLDPNDEKSKTACRFDYTVDYFEGTDRRCGIVDMAYRQILKWWNCLMTQTPAGYREVIGYGGNPMMTIHKYGGLLLPRLNVTFNERGRCVLTNENIDVVNMYHNFIANIASQTPFEFACCEGSVSDATNGAPSPLNDAFYFGDIAVRMFKDWYGVTPTKFKPRLGVHWGWNRANAAWNSPLAGVTIGDGNNVYYPFAVLNTIAHEFAHGFTERYSGLIYEEQPGGVNEAFSDIAGAAAEYYMTGRTKWTLGEDIRKDGQPLRYMNDPPRDGRSIDRAINYRSGMSVHRSSGIFNKAFTLIANRREWGVRHAFNSFVRANQLYWTPTTDFVFAACGVIQAARDIGYNWTVVKQAFSFVGVNCFETTTVQRQRDAVTYTCPVYERTDKSEHPVGRVDYIGWRTVQLLVADCTRNIKLNFKYERLPAERSGIGRILASSSQEPTVYLRRPLRNYSQRSASQLLDYKFNPRNGLELFEPEPGVWTAMVYSVWPIDEARFITEMDIGSKPKR